MPPTDGLVDGRTPCGSFVDLGLLRRRATRATRYDALAYRVHKGAARGTSDSKAQVEFDFGGSTGRQILLG